MRAKIGMALVGVIGLAVCVGLAWAEPAPKEKPAPAKEKSAPPGMVLVPAGEFIMGMDADKAFEECRKFNGDRQCFRNVFTHEEPAHEVYLDAFYIDKFEVSNADYRKCVEAGKCRDHYEGGNCSVFTGEKIEKGSRIDSEILERDHPVVCVDWNDAKNYCEWAGKRLPTEAEWEKAARGADGRMYPWGNEFDGKKANFCDKNCRFNWALEKWDDGYEYTAAVGSYPAGASPYGVMDMAGNVFEWTEDWYSEDYYTKSPAKNPQGPDTGVYRVLRGGCWYYNTYHLRAAFRDGLAPTSPRLDYIGFRCAGD